MAKKQPKKPKKTPPKPQGISWKAVGGILGGITTFMGGVVTWLDFIVHAQSGYPIFLWAGIAFFVVVWFIILWFLYKQRNAYGYIWLAVTVVAIVVTGTGWNSNKKAEEEKRIARDEKLIVLIANFDGPEEIYGLRNKIKEKLNEDFENNPDVIIETIDEIIKPESESDSPLARKIGKDRQADVVIWGWYRPTENPNITIHIENLAAQFTKYYEKSDTFQPTTTKAELESFSFQQQLGSETTALINFLAGLIQYQARNYTDSVFYFDKTIATFENALPPLFDIQALVYYYRGNSNLYLGENDLAFNDYSKAIILDPKYYTAYNNRGITFVNNGQYDKAIEDYSKAIEYSQNYLIAYINRGSTYSILEPYDLAVADLAIADLSKAIEINPQIAVVYDHRGYAYAFQEKYDLVTISKHFEGI